MKGLRYKIRINDDPTVVHSWMSREIEEMFIPDLGVYINAEAVFLREEGDRVPEEFEEICLDESICNELHSSLVSLEKAKDRIVRDFLSEED